MVKGTRVYFTLVVIAETTGACTRSLKRTVADGLASRWTRPPAIRNEAKLNAASARVCRYGTAGLFVSYRRNRDHRAVNRFFFFSQRKKEKQTKKRNRKEKRDGFCLSNFRVKIPVGFTVANFLRISSKRFRAKENWLNFREARVRRWRRAYDSRVFLSATLVISRSEVGISRVVCKFVSRQRAEGRGWEEEAIVSSRRR